MLSTVTLLMIAPLVSQSRNVHASENDTAYQPGMRKTYGIASYAKTGKGGKAGRSGKIGIDLRSKWNSVDGTQNGDYVHDHIQDGYLIANTYESGKKKGQLKTDGQPFGPTKKKFKTSEEGEHDLSTWVVYMNPKSSEAGKVGMLYKDALLYYPNTHKKGVKPGKPKHLDVRLVWNGSWRPGDMGKNNNLQFATNGIGIKEPYQGAANFTLQLYYHSSDAGTTGKPFKSIKTQIMQTDIDYKQGLIFNTPGYLIYDKSTALMLVLQMCHGIRMFLAKLLFLAIRVQAFLIIKGLFTVIKRKANLPIFLKKRLINLI